MNETQKPVEKELKPLVIGKETIKRLKARSAIKAANTQTSVCSMCTP
ncbi:MAG TPA: hypothetical protein VGH20_01265 [Myxococcales bacterium]